MIVFDRGFYDGLLIMEDVVQLEKFEKLVGFEAVFVRYLLQLYLLFKLRISPQKCPHRL